MAGIIALATNVVSAADMSSTQKKQIEGVVHDYLIANPDVVVQSLQSYQRTQMEQAQKTIEKTQQSSPKFAEDLFHQTSDPVVGNPKGKITVVEFFDYQCPHCVDMTPVLEEIVKNNPDVRIIFKEFPIRGPVSEFAARAALAANEQGKYFEFHKGLMTTKTQPLTQDEIIEIAKSVGVDTTKLTDTMKGTKVNDKLKQNYQLAQKLQLMGTPALFIAKSTVSKDSPATEIVFVPGQVTASQLQEIIKKMS